MTTKRPTRSSRRQRRVCQRPTTYQPYVDPDGAITLEEWRRSVAKAPAVQILTVSDHLVA